MRKLLRPVVSLGLLAWLGWHVPWAQIIAAFGRLRTEYWLAALALYVATQFVSSLRWQMLARPLGFRRSLWQLTGFYFIGMFFNLVLPTSVGGDVVRAWYLAGKSGHRLPAFLSVFVDRLSGLLVLLALACVAVLFCPIDLPAWVPASVWASAAAGAVAMVMLPLLARGSARWRRFDRVHQALALYRERPGLLLGTTALSLGVQAANVVLVWLVGSAIGAPVPAAYYWIMVPMVTLLTLLPVSVNGMGIREGATVLFLGPLGVDAGTAAGLAFLWFLVFTAAGLLGGAVYFLGCFPRPEVRTDHGSVGDHSHQGRTGQYPAAA